MGKMASSGSARNTPPANSPTAAPVNFKANYEREVKIVLHMVDFFFIKKFIITHCCLRGLKLLIKLPF